MVKNTLRSNLDWFINTGFLPNECWNRYLIFYMLFESEEAIIDSQYLLRPNRAITLRFNEREHYIYLFITFLTKSRNTFRPSWFKASRTLIKLQCLSEGSHALTFLQSLDLNLLFYDGSSWYRLTLRNDLSFIHLCTRRIQPLAK